MAQTRELIDKVLAKHAAFDGLRFLYSTQFSCKYGLPFWQARSQQITKSLEGIGKVQDSLEWRVANHRLQLLYTFVAVVLA